MEFAKSSFNLQMIKMENMRNFGEFFKITIASTPFGNDFFSLQFHLEMTFSRKWRNQHFCINRKKYYDKMFGRGFNLYQIAGKKRESKQKKMRERHSNL